MKSIYLRMDDIGASTKHFEIYAKFKPANFLFLKYIPPFRAWGRYDELNLHQWNQILDVLIKYNAKLTVGITASWVDKSSNLIPFPEKFPKQAGLLKLASEEGLIEIANHGLTHCVVGEHLPRLFTSNRTFHREFWDWLPKEIHFKHIEKSQAIFLEWIGLEPTTLIPPGNVYSIDTMKAAEKYGIKRINSYIKHNIDSQINIINKDNIVAFHDRELVLYGIDWLEERLKSFSNTSNYCFIKEL